MAVKYSLLVFLIVITVAANAQSELHGKSDFNIENYGAVPGGVVNNTIAIQKAIDDCTKKGGGTVIIPSGVFLTGKLYLKSNIELHLVNGATLLGSNQVKDYLAPPQQRREPMSLIYANNAENVSITGEGIIDGQGGSPEFQQGDSGLGRPKLLLFARCKNVKVLNVTLRNSASWVQHYLTCDGVVIRGVKVYSFCNWNNDGLDIDSKNVIVSDCYIEADDDAICLKSEAPGPGGCENITITNCVLASNCNAIKLGTGSQQKFKNITISNIVVKAAPVDTHHQWVKKLQHIFAETTNLAGIALESVDGGELDQVSISNITMTGVQTPIFIRLGDRKKNLNNPQSPRVSTLKNVLINNVTATSQSLMTSSITGVSGHYAENVTLSNIQITSPGGGTAEYAAKEVPEKEATYPENRMFGHTLPASGFYVRHVKNITFNNVQCISASAEARPVLLLDDVEGVNIQNCNINNTNDAGTFIRLINTRQAMISGNSIRTKMQSFLSIEGNTTDNIFLINNTYKLAEQAIDKKPDVKKSAVVIK